MAITGAGEAGDWVGSVEFLLVVSCGCFVRYSSHKCKHANKTDSSELLNNIITNLQKEENISYIYF